MSARLREWCLNRVPRCSGLALTAAAIIIQSCTLIHLRSEAIFFVARADRSSVW